MDNTGGNTTGKGTDVLIPVDFSEKGSLAIKVGFELARRLSENVCLLHASIIAEPMVMPQFPDDFYGIDNENTELEEIEMNEEVHTIDSKDMGDLKNKIHSLQKGGGLPDIKFKTSIAPGTPEEVISEYCEEHKPKVIVMATRGREKRHEELVGSVTIEVIDHCVAPVLTVPEDYSFAGFKDIVRICAFCYFDEGDFKGISYLMDMFNNPEVKIFLFPAVDKYKNEALSEKLSTLQSELQKAYPQCEFSYVNPGSIKNAREEAEAFFIKEDIQMILAPNRKRNAIARFFNPGVAHKILYEIDFPLLAIPV